MLRAARLWEVIVIQWRRVTLSVYASLKHEKHIRPALLNNSFRLISSLAENFYLVNKFVNFFSRYSDRYCLCRYIKNLTTILKEIIKRWKERNNDEKREWEKPCKPLVMTLGLRRPKFQYWSNHGSPFHLQDNLKNLLSSRTANGGMISRKEQRPSGWSA